MDFKSNKRNDKKKVFFDDAPKTYLLDEENEWEELRTTVASDPKDSKKKFIPFSKESSAFDELPEEDLRKVEVNIKLSLPKVNVARFKKAGRLKTIVGGVPKLAKLTKLRIGKKYLALGSVSLILIMAGIVVGNKYLFSDKNEGAEVAGTSKTTASDVPEPTSDPQFEIVKPQGRDLPKEKIAYDSKRNFAKYEDDINGTPITVSQQPLPESFKADPAGGVAKLARDFGATEELVTEDTKMYYGIDEKGPQTLIFTKNGVLIFIATSKEVEKLSLQVYAGNLD